MNMKPSPLRHLDLSDDAVAADMVDDKARQLIAAYDRIEALQEALKELLTLVEMIAGNSSTHPAIRVAITTCNTVTDARELLR